MYNILSYILTFVLSVIICTFYVLDHMVARTVVSWNLPHFLVVPT